MLSGTFVAHYNILYAQGKIETVVSETQKSMVIVGMLIGVPIGFLMVFSGVFYNLWVPGQDAQLLQKITIFTVLPMILGGSINPIFGLFTITDKLKVPSLVVLGAGILQILIIIVLISYTSLGIWAIIYVSMIQSIIRNVLFTPIYGAFVLSKPLLTFFPTMLRGIAGMMVVTAIALGYQYIVTVNDWTQLFIAGLFVCISSLSINLYVMLRKDERVQFFAIVEKKIHFNLTKYA